MSLFCSLHTIFNLANLLRLLQSCIPSDSTPIGFFTFCQINSRSRCIGLLFGVPATAEERALAFPVLDTRTSVETTRGSITQGQRQSLTTLSNISSDTIVSTVLIRSDVSCPSDRTLRNGASAIRDDPFHPIATEFLPPSDRVFSWIATKKLRQHDGTNRKPEGGSIQPRVADPPPTRS